MTVQKLSDSVTDFIQPYWYLLAFGLALIGVAFVFASQTLIIYSPSFFVDAAIYITLQVAGWIILIEWLRLAGHLTLPPDS